MWDTAYREIRRIAPGATIVGPDFAYTPQRNPGEWQTWLAHVKAAGTVPDMITNHDEGDVDDPVAVSQALNSDLAAAGLSRIPLSANEYQPADRQTAGVTAWYLARFAQSGYTNAMRGNWQCCLTPNLTGVLTQTASGWAAERQLVGDARLRRHDRLPGVHLRAGRLDRDQRGRGQLAEKGRGHHRRLQRLHRRRSVTFSGLGSVPWLASNGSVNVVVDRIPDQYPLTRRRWSSARR